MSASNEQRIDTAAKVIKAAPSKIYNAIVEPEALVSWLPPQGMKGEMLEFDPRDGGAYRMSLTYMQKSASTFGKTTEDADVVQGKFLKLVTDEQVVQLVRFDSIDPAFAGEMTMTWLLEADAEGTKVTVICENVPYGIRKEDHDEGLKSSLDNLAAYMEGAKGSPM